MLAQHCRRDEAEQQWRQAAQGADALGAKPLRRSLDDLARRARIGTPPDLPDGKVLIAGGADERDYRGLLSSAELYDPQSGTFSPTGSMSKARFKLPDGIVLPGGRALIAGGAGPVEIYDPVTRTFATGRGEMDTARWYPTATLLPSGRVLITGGYDDDSAGTRQAWRYQAE